MSDSLRERAARLAPALALGAAVIVYLVAYEPLLDGHQRPMGSDYGEFLPRLLADHYWFRLNGWWSVPWFTPAFCGGMPDWANPQQMPYSLAQFLLVLFDPVRSVQITFAVAAITGATGTWVLLRRGFETSAPAALLGAVLFLFNGFFVSHLLVGHLPYHPFVLTPWIGWLLIQARTSRRELIQDALIGGLLLTVMIQGGMLTILLPVGAVWVTLGLIRGLSHPAPMAFWGRLVGVIGVGAAISASKLAATSAFAAQFPRDFYKLSGFKSLGTTLAASFRVLFMRPQSIDDQGYLRIAVKLPIHEGDYSISLVPLIIIVAALIFGRRQQAPAAQGRTVRLIAIGLLLLLPIALNTYSPGWMQFLKHVPIIRQSSSLLRWFLLYIPVLAVLAALAVDRLPGRTFFVAGGVVAAIAWSVTTDRAPWFEKSYFPTWIVKAWDDQRSGQPIPIIEKMDLKLMNGRPQTLVGADDVLIGSASQVFCIDPIFGYFHEALPWKALHDGPALEVTDGKLNVLNPACELFPKENNCKPGDPFLATQLADAEAFLSWSPFPFERPLKQRLADVVSLISLVGVLVLLVVNRRRPA